MLYSVALVSAKHQHETAISLFFLYVCVCVCMCVYNFIYLFLAVLGPHCCAGLFSSCVRASHCSGFSCCRVRAVGVQASVVAVHGHSSGGCLTPGHKFSCSLACGIFLDQGSNLSPPLAGTFFTAEPPGKPCAILFIHSTSP